MGKLIEALSPRIRGGQACLAKKIKPGNIRKIAIPDGDEVLKLIEKDLP